MDTTRSRRQFLTATGALAIGVALAGCGSDSGGDDGNGGESGGSGTTVEMTDELAFSPNTLTVSVGDTVTWDNVGSIGHSVTAYEDELPANASYFASGGFESEQAARDAYTPGDTDAGDIPGGQSWEHTFETAGIYEYFCIPHEQAGMKGTIEVQ